MSRFVVSIRDITDRNTLASILYADPICIRKINANSSGRILVTTQHGSTDSVGSDALYLFLTETRVNGRMILKPLGVLTDCLCTFRCLQIFIFHKSFPRTFQAQGIAIHFYETIDEVYPTLQFFYPLLTIGIKTLQIACAVIGYQMINDLYLPIILRIVLCLFQPKDYLFYCLGIFFSNTPHLFSQCSIVFYQRTIQSKRRRFFSLIGILLLLIEIFRFLLSDILIEITGRCFYEVISVILVDTLGKHLWMEDDRKQFIAECIQTLIFP